MQSAAIALAARPVGAASAPRQRRDVRSRGCGARATRDRSRDTASRAGGGLDVVVRPGFVGTGAGGFAARRRYRAVGTARARMGGVEIFDEPAVESTSYSYDEQPPARRGSSNFGGSRVDIFDDDKNQPPPTVALPSEEERREASAALAKAEPLHELEDIIRVRGYDPKAIDEYFWSHPAQLAERAADVTKALATISWLLYREDYANLAPTIERLGPTYVKFGQALASRGDIVGAEVATALEKLQDDMEAAPLELARAIVAEECPRALSVLDDGEPIAAASLSQVYKGQVDGRTVAVKVQRPGICARVAADAALLRAAAKVLEATAGTRFKAQAVAAVDEFASRIFEEMDFANEANNIRKFDALYGPQGTNRRALPPPGYVRVPGLIPSLPATRRVLVMEWMEGQSIIKLVSQKPEDEERWREQMSQDSQDEDCAVTWDEEVCNRRQASLPLVELGIRCTLSQLIETGVMHADPHGGNLLRLKASGELAYLDFGLVSEVPPEVRDGLVAAVTLLIFSRDYVGVASLFGDLQLVPRDVLENEYQLNSLVQSLKEAADSALVFPEDECVGEDCAEEESEADARLRRARNAVPDVRFDQLLGALFALVPKYRFVLPPYFLNNARALATLEGMARNADPNFNILRVVYPFAVKRLLSNPTGSPVLKRVLRQLVRDKRSRGWKGLSLIRLQAVVDDAAALTGVPRWHIVRSTLKTRAGWSLAFESVFSAFYWCMTYVMQVFWFVTGVTPLMMLYKKTVTFFSGGVQNEPV